MKRDRKSDTKSGNREPEQNYCLGTVSNEPPGGGGGAFFPRKYWNAFPINIPELETRLQDVKASLSPPNNWINSY